MTTKNLSSPPLTSTLAPRKALVVAALGTVYLVWGSTYLGIKIAIETMPPLIMGGMRFVIAGLILYSFLRWRGCQNPTKGHWLNAFIVGTLLVGCGNGAVTWAEQKVDSGLAALLIAVTPLWINLFDTIRPGGRAPGRITIIGILIGFSGTVLLIGNPLSRPSDAVNLLGAAVIVMGSISWAIGSIYARYTEKPTDPLMGIALQMVLGGGALTLTGFVSGEWSSFPATDWSMRSLLSFTYLVFVGSLVAFTAYSWLIKHCRPSLLATYAFVNPIIAVFLGWLIVDEPITRRIIISATIIVAGVALITWQSGRGTTARS